jgi:hypothetical protein
MCVNVGVQTAGGKMHFVLIQDEASRYLWGFLVRAKKETTECAMVLIKTLLAYGHHVGLFASDQGKELVNKPMKEFLVAHGVYYEWTNPYSPEENCLVEKMNGVVMAMVRAVLTTADQDDALWGGAFRFVVDVLNVSPTKALGGDTPYTRLYEAKPFVGHIRPWGIAAFIFTPKKLRDSKLENPGLPALFLGYPSNSIGYRLLCLTTGKIVERRDVVFREDLAVSRRFVKDLLMTKPSQQERVLTPIPFISFPVVGGPSEQSNLPTVDRNWLVSTEVTAVGAAGTQPLEGGPEDEDSDGEDWGSPSQQPIPRVPGRVLPIADADNEGAAATENGTVSLPCDPPDAPDVLPQPQPETDDDFDFWWWVRVRLGCQLRGSSK